MPISSASRVPSFQPRRRNVCRPLAAVKGRCRGSFVRQRIGRPQPRRDLVQSPADRDWPLDEVEAAQQKPRAGFELDDKREQADIDSRALVTAKKVEVADAGLSGAGLG